MLHEQMDVVPVLPLEFRRFVCVLAEVEDSNNNSSNCKICNPRASSSYRLGRSVRVDGNSGADVGEPDLADELLQ